MAFNDFTHRIQMYPTKDMRDWVYDNVQPGRWGYMISLVGTTETFCFEHEEDLLAFKLIFGKDESR
jgi:hypothetical protein